MTRRAEDEPIPLDEELFRSVSADDILPYPVEDPTNAAHAEVRLRPVGGVFNKNHKPPKPVLFKARDELARRLRIVIPPR